MSNVFWENIRYINAFNKYKIYIILFEKIIWYRILSSRLSNLHTRPILRLP